MNEMVSVIVPVYKVEEYLDACVESICRQTYLNLEIILVDDGSPDQCPQMCDEWKNRDSRVKVIHQANKGLSGARNIGLQNSNGGWVLYVDSDDTIEEDMVSHLLELAHQYDADVAVSTFRFIGENEQRRRLSGEVICGTPGALLQIIAEEGLWQAWAKLIKKEIALRHPFTEKRIYEDYENTPQLLVDTDRVVLSMDGRYHYTVRGNSIMGERQKSTSSDFAKITEQNIVLYSNSGFSSSEIDVLNKFLFKQLIYNYHTTIKTDRQSEFLFLCRRIMREHKKAWIHNKSIGSVRKMVYFTIAYCHLLYDVVYKISHMLNRWK